MTRNNIHILMILFSECLNIFAFALELIKYVISFAPFKTARYLYFYLNEHVIAADERDCNWLLAIYGFVSVLWNPNHPQHVYIYFLFNTSHTRVFLFTSVLPTAGILIMTIFDTLIFIFNEIWYSQLFR